MTFFSMVLLALGLAMDAFAVSITGGMVTSSINILFALKIALFFAGFQMIMPWLGWWFGRNIATYMECCNYLIASLLLFLIGFKMAYESFQYKENKQCLNFKSISVLFLLAIATSIDAFAAGVSLSFLGPDIVKALWIIGTTTLLLSLLGVSIGKMLGHVLKRYAELAGGVILILIGLQVLVGHLGG
jgi:putative Mn2+ efflux pump MntP